MRLDAEAAGWLGQSEASIAERLDGLGVRSVHAARVFSWMQRESQGPLVDSALPARAVELFPRHPLEGFEPSSNVTSEDGTTRKFLLELADGQLIETVAMGYPGRFTACLSTQAGCALGCVFCATGRMGFSRQLTTGEIVAQALFARAVLRASGQHLRNVVLMGMGEPLANYDASLAALDILTNPRGLGIAPRHVTINSVGVVPGIVRLADERRPYCLGVSLHASNDPERSALLPVNERWPLSTLLEACRYYTGATGRRIFFSWTLIDGVNDSLEQARELAALLGAQRAHVNLIRLNPTAGYEGRESSGNAAAAFAAVLQTAGLPCTLRQKRGVEVAAGCGQLSTQKRPVRLRRDTNQRAPERTD